MRWYVRRDGERVKESDPHFKVYVPRWVDPYWFIWGSVPEKMVMAELIRRGVYFEHVPQSNTIGGLVDPTWEPDFLFPQFKIWMEINGLYFHTKPGAIEADALRYAKIEAEGWRVIVWWDYDILDHLADLMNAVPEFYFVDHAKPKDAPTTLDLPFYTGGLEVDHLAGLRKALANRRKPPQGLARRYRMPWERRPK